MSEFAVRMKLNVVGSEKVGKTSLLTRYKFDKFPDEPVSKLFEKSSQYELHHTVTKHSESNEEVDVELWETLVNEYNDRIRPLHYPFSDVFVLCFAINSNNSFSEITDKWLPELKRWTPKVPILLVGTKSDLRQTENDDSPKVDELISNTDGEKLAEEIMAIKYLECSAKTGDGVAKVFKEAFGPGLLNFETRKFKHNKKVNRRKWCTVL